MRKLILFAGILTAFIACQESLEDRAAKEAETYTRKNCPMPLNEHIDMDSMTFDRPTHTFCYHYTMKGTLDDASAMRPEEMRQQLLEGVKNLTAARTYMDEGYSFRYVYRSKSHPETILFETLFTDKDYQ
jgi:hypothetical protein